MGKYDNDYYFVAKREKSDHLPSLIPDTNTEDRRFRYEAQHMASAPLIFSNGWKEENLKSRIKDVAADTLFDGSNLMVCSRIREELIKFDIPNLHIHPAIYIDDRNKWHENYWYMTFTEMFDCWDRKNSTFEEEPLEMGGFKLYSVYTYSLNEELLDKTPLEQRLLFKMGNTQDGMIVCHKSIMRMFINEGTQLTKVSEY
jgi:hypothetical protein